MLLECQNCGAPLDVASGARSVKCNYCGTSSQVKASRTVAFETPKDWVPPPAWTPPPEKNLGEQSFVYHAAKKTIRTVVSLVSFGIVVTIGLAAYGLLRVVGQAGAPLSAMEGAELNEVMGQAMNAIQQAKNAAAAAQLAVLTPTNVTLPLTCSGNDTVTLTGQALMVENGTPLLVRGNCTLPSPPAARRSPCARTCPGRPRSRRCSPRSTRSARSTR
jgi:LSD1 subclass zinc finger protein